jgi:hypothetical protein
MKANLVKHDTGRCRCGGTLDACNYFPVELLAEAAARGRAWGADVIAFFGCRVCGEWTAEPAERVPKGSVPQRAGEA